MGTGSGTDAVRTFSFERSYRLSAQAVPSIPGAGAVKRRRLDEATDHIESFLPGWVGGRERRSVWIDSRRNA